MLLLKTEVTLLFFLIYNGSDALMIPLLVIIIIITF